MHFDFSLFVFEFIFFVFDYIFEVFHVEVVCVFDVPQSSLPHSARDIHIHSSESFSGHFIFILKHS